MNFGGVGRRILLPLDKAKLAVSSLMLSALTVQMWERYLSVNAKENN